MKNKLFIDVYSRDIVVDAVKDENAPRIVIEPSKNGYICGLYSVIGQNAKVAGEHASITNYSLWTNEQGELILKKG